MDQEVAITTLTPTTTTTAADRPGERALLAMQSLTNAVSIFKVPRAPPKMEPHQQLPKRQKMKILTEERYIEVCVCARQRIVINRYIKIICNNKYLLVLQELGKIIQKDFFPDLEKLKAQNQYLDAVERNDVIKLRELYAKYSGNKPTNTGCKLYAIIIVFYYLYANQITYSYSYVSCSSRRKSGHI